IEAARARSAEEEAERMLAAYPDWMHRLKGDEAERLDALARRARAAEEGRAVAASRLESARESVAEAKLPEYGLPAGLLAELDETIGALRERAKAIEDLAQELAAAQGGMAEARRLLGESVTDEQLAALEPTAFDEVAAHL